MAKSAKSFRKHGTYIYEVAETVADYGSTQLTVEAMQKAGMSHAWVRIHSQTAYSAKDKKIIRQMEHLFFSSGLDAAFAKLAARPLWGGLEYAARTVRHLMGCGSHLGPVLGQLSVHPSPRNPRP